MIIKKSIFIDGSFLFHNAQALGVKLDFNKLLKFLLKPTDYLVQAAYYTAIPNDKDIDENHKKFIRVLKKDVRLKVHTVPLLKSYRSGNAESVRYSKGEDILLACEMLKGALLSHYDEAVLVSGDGDFVPCVNMMQQFGKRAIVASFRSSFNRTLELEANEVIYLDDHLDSLRYTSDDV
jgi:uncharacterized LabA/DUF88 family protein